VGDVLPSLFGCKVIPDNNDIISTAAAIISRLFQAIRDIKMVRVSVVPSRLPTKAENETIITNA
jgi:hypothetical protein